MKKAIIPCKIIEINLGTGKVKDLDPLREMDFLYLEKKSMDLSTPPEIAKAMRREIARRESGRQTA